MRVVHLVKAFTLKLVCSVGHRFESHPCCIASFFVLDFSNFKSERTIKLLGVALQTARPLIVS